MRTIGRTKQLATPYIRANLERCEACGRCFKACPKQVFGKAGFLWNKRLIAKNPDSCTGCGVCVKICPLGLFSELRRTTDDWSERRIVER